MALRCDRRVGVECFEFPPEGRGVVWLPKMRQLVQHDGSNELGREEDQAPVERYRAARRAAAPPVSLSANGGPRVAEPRVRRLLVEQRQEALGSGTLQPTPKCRKTGLGVVDGALNHEQVPTYARSHGGRIVRRYSTPQVSPVAANSTTSGKSASDPARKMARRSAKRTLALSIQSRRSRSNSEGSKSRMRRGTTTTSPSRGVIVSRTRRARSLSRTVCAGRSACAGTWVSRGLCVPASSVSRISSVVVRCL